MVYSLWPCWGCSSWLRSLLHLQCQPEPAWAPNIFYKKLPKYVWAKLGWLTLQSLRLPLLSAHCDVITVRHSTAELTHLVTRLNTNGLLSLIPGGRGRRYSWWSFVCLNRKFIYVILHLIAELGICLFSQLNVWISGDTFRNNINSICQD